MTDTYYDIKSYSYYPYSRRRDDTDWVGGKLKYNYYIVLYTIMVPNYVAHINISEYQLNRFKTFLSDIFKEFKKLKITLNVNVNKNIIGELVSEIIIEGSKQKLEKINDQYGKYLYTRSFYFTTFDWPNFEIFFENMPSQRNIVQKFCPYIMICLDYSKKQLIRKHITGPYAIDHLTDEVMFRNIEDCVLAKLIIS
jgi:hypothetical protein